jgi:hypothetical protein
LRTVRVQQLAESAAGVLADMSASRNLNQRLMVESSGLLEAADTASQ